MTQLASDTIYRDLKQKGLALSPISEVVIPDSPPLQKGIFTKFTSVFSKKTQEATVDRIIIQPILNSAFVVVRQQMIYLYKYNIQDESCQLEIQPIQTIALGYQILQISTCDPKFVQDRGDVPILMRSKFGLTFFVFDIKEISLKEKKFIKQENFFGVGWISEKECIILANNKIWHYNIHQGMPSQKSSLDANLKVSGNEAVRGVWIMGQAEEQQDSKIIVFYCVTEKNIDLSEKHIPMKLKIKEFVRTLDGDLIRCPSKEDYEVESMSLQYRETFFIAGVGDYYCIQMPTEVVILKKKFDKYMFLDTMAEIMGGFKVRLSTKGMVSSIGEKLLELNCIQFSDPKCVSRICDIIQFPEEMMNLHLDFKEIWPIIIRKEYTLIFVFINNNKITFSSLVKMEPMQKVLALAEKSPGEPLEVIQDIAQNLGICRKDFYLKLWSTSKKSNSDIYKFLLPTKDIASIKKQLKSLLRRRTISVSEMLKILEKIDGIINEYLKTDLNHKNLKEYLKNDFLRRKLKLNEMDKMMDHRIFEKIYSSSLLNLFDDIVSEELDPKVIIYDPLHAMVDKEPIKELKSLQNVFQEFKVILLENYKEFLIEFLQKFPNKLLEVLRTFSFLLPNYPFEITVQKPLKTNETIIKDPKASHNDQPLWFQEITVTQWKTELTKQRILKMLYDEYPTSKIVETVDQFFNSLYGRENKKWKHGLITLNLDEYARKICELKGIQLYLDVCQFSNKLCIQQGKPDITNDIVQALEMKNKLKEPAIHDCKLYGKMHYFMLKNQIIPKDKLEISALTKLKPQNLVALFFLQNKQRKEHIFNEFKDLYEDKNEFKEVLQRFVQSQNCSRIQLEILMKEIIAKGRTFQEQNQDIIEILIIGLCMKVEIRENLSILDADEYDQGNSATLIENVALSKNLALKINRIKQLKRCLGIFKTFGLEKYTYEELLALEEDNKIFKVLMDKFFAARQDEESGELTVVLEGDTISLDNPRNMLTILVYLQETVYYSTKTFELLILYGLELILWKQFEVIKDIIADQQALEALDIRREEYMESLILRALDGIYLDSEIIYDEETKEQILCILDIDENMSPTKIRELAKLNIAKIFEDWKLEVHPCDIHTIAHEWKEKNRDVFMVDLINVYIENLSFKELQDIYIQLEITDKERLDVECLNQEYVTFCDVYAHKLLEKQKYSNVIQVLTYMMSIPDVEVSFVLLSETFLKSVFDRFKEDSETGRKMIQFFVQKYTSNQEHHIKQLLQNDFDETLFSVWQRVPSIFINSRFLYKEARGMCEFMLDDLWEMAKQQSNSNKEELYYNYFFLMMGLSNPNTGFIHISGISYNLQKITNLFLIHLENHIAKKQELWLTDYDHLLRKYMEGILREAVSRLEIEKDKQIAETTKVDIVLDLLRTKRSENEKFIGILSRVKGQVQNKNKRNARKDRFNKKLKEILEKQLQKQREMQAQPVEQPVEEPSQPQVFLDWKKIEDEKRIMTSKSNIFMSEKEMIDQIYESMLANHPLDTKHNAGTGKHNIFTNLFLPTVKSLEDLNILIDMVQKGEAERIANYPLNLVAEALKQVSKSEEYPFAYIIEFMIAANIGDPAKREIAKITQFFKGNLPDQYLKHIFSVEFLIERLECSEEEKYQSIYKQIKPKILDIIPEITSSNLKLLAQLMGSSLESVEYSAQVYFETLMWLGQIATFDSHYAILAQECIAGLGDYPDIIGNRFKKILDNVTADPEMKKYVREWLIRLMEEKGFHDVSKEIKRA